MSLYQQKLRKSINEQSEIINQFRIHIEETKMELENEINTFDKIRLLRRLRVLYSTKRICEECLKNKLKQIH